MQLFNSFSGKNVIKEILRHERCAEYVFECFPPDFLKEVVKPYSDIKSQLKTFSGIGDKNPSETVAKVSRASLREEIVHSVKKKVFENNLPYIHLSYYPMGYRTICAFRVDCDVTDRASFFNLLNHAEKHELPMTWFIDVASQESYMKEVASIRKAGHDIQLHCYNHVTYGNYRKNEKNIRKGKDLMEASGIPITGFVSPFGQWNPSLNKVLEDMKFQYSSEFAIGYDDLPFYPVFDRHISSVLQIPIHPICIGSLRNAGFTLHEMIAYFDKIINMKYERGNPVILYGHPRNEIDRYPEIIDFVFSSMKKLHEIWFTTFTEYSSWWQRRLKVEFNVRIEGDIIRIATDNTDLSLALYFEKPDSTQAVLPLADQTTSLSKLDWSVKESILSAPTDKFGVLPS